MLNNIVLLPPKSLTLYLYKLKLFITIKALHLIQKNILNLHA